MTEGGVMDKRVRLEEINRDWGWWTPEARNEARLWMEAELEAAWERESRHDQELVDSCNLRQMEAEEDAAYQRRHRKWALKEARGWLHQAIISLRHNLWEDALARAEAAEKELADYKQDCTATHEADNERCKELEAQRDRLREALEEYGTHQLSCPLAHWHEGRPTEGGGYETRYGDKWYPRGQEPPCTCGLDAALEEAEK